MKVKVLTIDGPSGAGKSTVARGAARRLGWQYIDTGAMYRSVGLKADRLGVALDDDGALAEMCATTAISLAPDDQRGVRVFLDGEEVTDAIREHRVSDLASRVSARRPVREAMGRFQRRLGEQSPSVLEGRDIGTVIFPDALCKVFLTATPEERARRRTEDLARRGQTARYEQVLVDILERDRNDSSRAHAPLRAASDAVRLDTTGLEIDQVIARLVEGVRKAEGSGG